MFDWHIHLDVQRLNPELPGDQCSFVFVNDIHFCQMQFTRLAQPRVLKPLQKQKSHPAIPSLHSAIPSHKTIDVIGTREA